ncbi:transcriptional regulator PpsR [Rhodothalassium salexigens DSM 2132]|uniref:Transcriptional regulator PpsR n=1 Tax=Rhodothalassium salexigens DSM 2132 TaxID=1188247 RepID=A0A4R2PIL3_RHOSA|nr:transcriptional regulator PpsR [Rhodothalassium salexigens DSM 2132]
MLGGAKGQNAWEPVRRFNAAKESLGDLHADVAEMILAASADIALVLDRDGVILDLTFGQEDHVIVGADEWPGLLFTDIVSVDTQPKVEALLDEAESVEKPSRWRQVNHPLPGGDEAPVQYIVVPLGRDGRKVAIGRDLRNLASLQQQLIQAQQAMERDYSRFRSAETRYRLLFQMSSEAVLVINARTREVTEANAAAGAALGADPKKLVGQRFPQGFDPAGEAAVGELLESVRTAGGTDEVSARLSSGEKSFLISASMFSQDTTPFYLVRLRIVGAEGGEAIMPVARSRVLDVVEKSPDGFVITDGKGYIEVANRAFLSMVQLVSEQQILGQSLERWIAKPGVGLNALLANLRQTGTVRLFNTTLQGEYDEATEVEISAVEVKGEDKPCYGFMIRNIGRRFASGSVVPGDLRNSVKYMTELVGRVSLKEIVSETTDVIERLCIEAALELTGDNRASAAEMLGLSRQSLYVKMRRYGVGESESNIRN